MMLTPDQLAEIRERDAATDGDEMGRVSKDRRALLKDREAIAERLLDVAEFLRGVNYARDMLGERHDNTTRAEQDLRAILNDMGVRDGD